RAGRVTPDHAVVGRSRRRSSQDVEPAAVLEISRGNRRADVEVQGVGEELAPQAGVRVEVVKRACGDVLAAVDAHVRVAHRGPSDDIAEARAGGVAHGHEGPHVELQGVGEELRQETAAGGVEGPLGDVLAVVDAHVGVAGRRPGDYLGEAVTGQVPHCDIGADVEV